MRCRLLLAAAPALALGAASLPGSSEALQEALEAIARDKAAQYNCSVVVGVRDGRGGSWQAAGGVADFATGRLAKADDPFVLGSITKTFTGPAALQLVDRGVWHLDAPFAPLVDPMLQRAGRPALARKFGPGAARITLRHLLHMTAGLPDYDTSWNKGDPWRFRQYARPQHDFSPLEIYDALPGNLTWEPGSRQLYCSSNYLLVGLALAQQAGAASWEDYEQRAVVPAKFWQLGKLANLRFAKRGPCSVFTPERGYDRMGPPVRPVDPGPRGAKDVSGVSCLGGWTAGNAIAPVADIAAWTEALFRAGSEVVSDKMQAAMRDTWAPSSAQGPGNYYGMAAFNMSLASGLPWPEGEAWGHLGSTYGFQSVTAFFPASGATVVVATNLEIRQQDTPSDALCSAYHHLLSHMRGKPFPRCSYTRSGYFFGLCNCSVPAEAAGGGSPEPAAAVVV